MNEPLSSAANAVGIKVTASESGSYAGAAVSIASSLTLTQVGVMVGIITALLTFVINAVYTYRKDRREQRECDARVAQLERGA